MKRLMKERRASERSFSAISSEEWEKEGKRERLATREVGREMKIPRVRWKRVKRSLKGKRTRKEVRCAKARSARRIRKKVKMAQRIERSWRMVKRALKEVRNPFLKLSREGCPRDEVFRVPGGWMGKGKVYEREGKRNKGKEKEIKGRERKR